MTLSEYLDKWLIDTKPNLEYKTYMRYRDIVNLSSDTILDCPRKADRTQTSNRVGNEPGFLLSIFFLAGICYLMAKEP